MRALAPSAALVFALALGAVGAVLPRAAMATPSLDACTGVLHREAGATTATAIESPGTWCLDQDLVEHADVLDDRSMIAVDVSDVTIDCRGYRIAYTGATDTMFGIVVRGPGTRDRVTVRNCDLHGFSNAIAMGPTRDFLVEDNTVHASRANASGLATAIEAWGNGIVRRNHLHDSINRAIRVAGGSQVTDNLIDGVLATAQQSVARGIEIYDSMKVVRDTPVRGNTVRGLVSSAPNQIMALAILSSPADVGTEVSGNVFIHDGSTGPVGIYCDSGARVFDNVIAGFFAPMVGSCVDTDDNDISP
jgi:Right handed beta helix region